MVQGSSVRGMGANSIRTAADIGAPCTFEGTLRSPAAPCLSVSTENLAPTLGSSSSTSRCELQTSETYSLSYELLKKQPDEPSGQQSSVEGSYSWHVEPNEKRFIRLFFKRYFTFLPSITPLTRQYTVRSKAHKTRRNVCLRLNSSFLYTFQLHESRQRFDTANTSMKNKLLLLEHSL